MRLNRHHIFYSPEWCVEIPQHFHRSLSIFERTNPTKEKLMILWNCQNALNKEMIRTAMMLDTGIDLNVIHGKAEK